MFPLHFIMMETDNHLLIGDETYTIILNSKASDNESIPRAAGVKENEILKTTQDIDDFFM